MLEDVYAKVRNRQLDEACDLIVGHIDDLCLEGDFAAVDELLTSIDVEQLDSFTLVAFLSITYVPFLEGKLKARKAFVETSEKYLRRTEGERTEELLKGLH